jgi:hypothetical protein
MLILTTDFRPPAIKIPRKNNVGKTQVGKSIERTKAYFSSFIDLKQSKTEEIVALHSWCKFTTKQIILQFVIHLQIVNAPTLHFRVT